MCRVIVACVACLASSLAWAQAPGFYIEGGQVMRVDADTPRGRALALPDQTPVLFANDAAHERLLVGMGTRDVAPNSCQAPGTDLAWVSHDGKQVKVITAGLDVLHAALDPQGRRIAYSTRDAFLFLLDETGRPELLAEDALGPAWSPDGTRIAYSSMPPNPPVGDPRLGLRVLDLTTGETSTLTSGFGDVRPIWTPDGASILFLSGGRTGLASVFEVPAQGGAVTQLTNQGETRVTQRFVPPPGQDAFWQGDTLFYSVRHDTQTSVWALQRQAPGVARVDRQCDAARVLPFQGAALAVWTNDDTQARTMLLQEARP